jgi:hypothetical protein
VTSREVLAFDLYGTLVDPIAVSSELGQVLGDSAGREAARLWRLKQLEYSFRLTAMGRYEDFRWVTSRAECSGADQDRSARRDQNVPSPGPQHGHGIRGPGPSPAKPQMDQAHAVARRLAATGKPISRRALRSGGVRDSNQALNALAHMINAERAGVMSWGATSKAGR